MHRHTASTGPRSPKFMTRASSFVLHQTGTSLHATHHPGKPTPVALTWPPCSRPSRGASWLTCFRCRSGGRTGSSAAHMLERFALTHGEHCTRRSALSLERGWHGGTRAMAAKRSVLRSGEPSLARAHRAASRPNVPPHSPEDEMTRDRGVIQDAPRRDSRTEQDMDAVEAVASVGSDIISSSWRRLIIIPATHSAPAAASQTHTQHKTPPPASHRIALDPSIGFT